MSSNLYVFIPSEPEQPDDCCCWYRYISTIHIHFFQIYIKPLNLTLLLQILRLCLCTKVIRHPPVGELHPFPMPETRWDTLSINFVVELPKSSRYNAVMTVVDSVLKWAHFILMHTAVTVEGVARLSLHNVWKLHRLPKHVILDCGPQFIAFFTKELYRLLGIQLASSMTW